MASITHCEDARHDLDTVIQMRAERRVPAWDIARIVGFENCFYVAGSCLNAEPPNDIDVYLTEKVSLQSLLTDEIKKAYPVLASTRNAITFNVKGKVVQICAYTKNSLQELVDSFDYAHCQVGVKYDSARYDENCGETGGYRTPEIDEVYCSEDWKTAKMIQCSYYTGSEYPLSSMIRIIKYANRGKFSGRSYIIDILKIMTEIVDRGYKDYNDFKDQLDAVDLALLGDADAEGKNRNEVSSAAWNLWCAMAKHGLVEKVDKDTQEDEV